MKSIRLDDATELVILDSGSVVQIKKESGGGNTITHGLSLRLTERDYQLFAFLLDQKFASLETLYYRFFDHRKSIHDRPPKEFFVARQRLALLKRAGLITTQRVYSESKSVYLLTQLGSRALEGKFPNAIYAQPVREVDFRNYDHDRRVNLVRVCFEREKKVLQWWSERRLKAHSFSAEGCSDTLPESIVPDGIFLSAKGERVAVEVEASNRMKSRFEEKVSAYRSVMSSYDPKSALIQKVLFVACSDALHTKLTKVIDGRKGFLIESYTHFLGKLYAPLPGAAAAAPGLTRAPTQVVKASAQVAMKESGD
jgi:hypothetical protein